MKKDGRGGRIGHKPTYTKHKTEEEKELELLQVYTDACLRVMPLCPAYGEVYTTSELYKKIKEYVTVTRPYLGEFIHGKEPMRFKMADAVQAVSYCRKKNAEVRVPLVKKVIRMYLNGEL